MRVNAIALIPSHNEIINTMTVTLTRTPQRLVLSNGE